MVKAAAAGLAIPLLLLAAIGCAQQQVPLVQRQPIVVKKAVPVPCPEPPDVAIPTLPIYTLSPNATDAEIIKAYAVSESMLEAVVVKQKTVLEAYRKQIAP